MANFVESSYRFCPCSNENEKTIYPYGNNLDELDIIILKKFNLPSNYEGGGEIKKKPSLTIEVDVPNNFPNIVTPESNSNLDNKPDNIIEYLVTAFADIETITRCDFNDKDSMWKITSTYKPKDYYSYNSINTIPINSDKSYVWYYSTKEIYKRCAHNPNNPFGINVTPISTFEKDLEDSIGLAALGIKGGKRKRKIKTKRKKSLYRKSKKRSKRNRNKSRNKK